MILEKLIISAGNFSELYDEKVVAVYAENGKEMRLSPNSITFENNCCIIKEQGKKDIFIHDFIDMLEEGLNTGYESKNVFIEDFSKNRKEIISIYNIDKIIHLDIRKGEELPDEEP